jgi:hypothetical protein
MPLIFASAFQKHERKSLSLLETMSVGIPFSQYHLLKNIPARSSAVMLIVVGMICISALRWLVIVSMQSKLPSIGSGPMKSMAMLHPHTSGTGNGCRGPGSLDVLDLFHRQSTQEGMYDCSKSLCMFGQ